LLNTNLDRSFNQLVASACRNEHYKEVADLPLAAKLHAAVASSIAEGDAAAAEKTSDDLMDYIESFTRKTLDR
jgi:hypothetical protein